MKIAITGGSGFLGAATVLAAKEAGHDVVTFDRPEHDILGPLDGLGDADHVIHLAGMLGTAELFDEAEEAIISNVIGTLRILQWCEGHAAGFTGISMPPAFESVYTATKICANRLAEAWRLFRDVPVSTVVAYNAFGPGQKHGPGHPQKIIPTFAVEAWNNRSIPIWGDGEQTVDLVHANDIGKMLVEATKFGNGEVFDAGTGVALTVNQVAEQVIRITGSTAGVKRFPMRDGETPTEIVATGQGWGKLNWHPHLVLSDLIETVDWYKP